MVEKRHQGRAIKRPPSRIGRLLIALRESVGQRALSSGASPEFKKLIAKTRKKRLTREEASEWVQQITGYQVDKDTIRRVEVGRQSNPSAPLLRNLLKTYGLSDSEADAAINDSHLNERGGANPHFISNWRMRGLAMGEFGPTVNDALLIGDYATTWVEVEKASSGGFQQNEIELVVESDQVERPPLFEKKANDALIQNLKRKEKGGEGWADNQTFCLRSITQDIADDPEERRSLRVFFQRSWYRYNVIAKQEAGAEFRWQALQSAKTPLVPVPYLASGVGICINVICDNGKSIVIGQWSDGETFRKGEYDIAVVEGIRPTSDIKENQIDIFSVMLRALTEELGLKTSDKDLIEEYSIFEIGCDLEYYQWNFLSYVKINMSFDDIYRHWQSAKDRRENQTLQKIPLDRDEIINFVTGFPIWSCGAACAIRTLDYFSSEK